VAEELALDERLRHGRAIDLHVRLFFARTAGVDRLRDEVLARAALAGDEDRGRVHALEVVQHLEDALHGRALADEALVALLAAEVAHLAREAADVDRLLELQRELAQVEGLREVPRGAEARGVDGAVHGAVGSDDDRRDVELHLLHLAEHAEAVDLGHLEVDDERVGRLRRQHVEALLPVGRDDDVVALRAEVLGHRPADELLVVAHEHAQRARVGFLRLVGGGGAGRRGAGPHDVAYFDLRRKIGRMHVKIALPQQYMFTAMNLLRDDLIRIADQAFPDESADFNRSLLRITDIELAIMLGTYMERRAEIDMADLRELIASHLPTTALVLDRDGRISSATGLHSRALVVQKDVVGKRWDEVIAAPLAIAADIRGRLERAGETGREIVLPRVDAVIDGQPSQWRVTIARLEHAVAATMIHFEDLTDVVASEARAKRAEHLAKLGTLAASVAHEIRNPLAGISGAVQVVQSSLPTDDRRAQALQKVQEQIARLGHLVGDLLSFSRPVKVNVRPVDLQVVADAATTSEREVAVVEGAGRAMGDASLLTQVILNLVQNAAQAGAKGAGGRKEGPRRGHEPRRERLRRRAWHPPDLVEKIFEPFFTTKTRGTGLGLPIARKMVEGMGGTLQVVKSPDGGAGFEITLHPVED
jgi:signal transduction histidine kinase